MNASTPIEIGSRAPDFSLVTQNGDRRGLAEHLGVKNVLLVFYPFAFSGICTGELSEIRDHLEDFESEDVQAYAVSCDPMFALRGWADQEGYFFPLLSDFWPHGEVARAYGVFDEERGMSIRGTFLIDTEGIVRWTLVHGAGQGRDFDGYRAALADLTGVSAR
ncbi:peroxiredoxin [Nostocoides veronense]|uniref:Peroxiredoxin n=1 Tax=Nostocoides veronense TaxID=330836 RepID=A0ABP4XI76_9MICO